MAKVNSKSKGKRGELILVHALRSAGFPDVKRSVQYCGKATGTADLVGLPGVHVEAKNVERLNIWSALAQSKRDAEAEGKGEIPAVFFKRNRTGFYVAMPLTDFVSIYSVYIKERIKNE